MNLMQLKALCEVVDHGLSISGAAQALYRTQPSITRQLQELEKEVGLDLFVRQRNKLLDLTPVLGEFAFRLLSVFEKDRGNVAATRTGRVKCTAAPACQIFPTACRR